MRLDKYLLEKGHTKTRSKAQDIIQAGWVEVNGIIITKNSYDLKEEDEIIIHQPKLSFVSRAGYKLYDVLEDFHIDLSDRICMDVGASTGGFSDVCLQQGACLVYALDVGKDQLVDELRKDPRIRNMEQTNCRYLTKEMFHPLPDFACMDVSFISIKLLLPVLQTLMQQVEIVALIKPQFEAGKEHLGKNGVIKNKKVHMQVLKDMLSFVQDMNLFVHHLQASSILGRDGNKEFVMHIKAERCQKSFDYRKIVENYQVKR